jgi:8-oxo-dGTP diphosphatase
VNRPDSKKHVHVACALIERNGLVLAAQRSASMNLPLKWEFPGGKLEAGESAEECLQRELVEEMSVTIAVGRQLPLHTHSYDTFTVTLHPFVCTLASGTITLHEHAAITWLSPDELHTLDWLEADRPVLEAYAQLKSDFPPPFQGEGRGGDGLDCDVPGNCQPYTHLPPVLPLEGGGTLNLEKSKL